MLPRNIIRNTTEMSELLERITQHGDFRLKELQDILDGKEIKLIELGEIERYKNWYGTGNPFNFTPMLNSNRQIIRSACKDILINYDNKYIRVPKNLRLLVSESTDIISRLRYDNGRITSTVSPLPDLIVLRTTDVRTRRTYECVVGGIRFEDFQDSVLIPFIYGFRWIEPDDSQIMNLKVIGSLERHVKLSKPIRFDIASLKKILEKMMPDMNLSQFEFEELDQLEMFHTLTNIVFDFMTCTFGRSLELVHLMSRFGKSLMEYIDEHLELKRRCAS